MPGGRLLTVRPVVVADVVGLGTLFGGLDEDDMYRRFFSAHPPPARFIEQMTTVSDRGDFGVVAVLSGSGRDDRLVGEAGYARLPGGDAEVGITVACALRGWLGPYLLDLLVAEARSQGIPNLQAEVLMANRRMMSLLESRGMAVIECYENPAIARVCIGTKGRTPVWSGDAAAPRLLVEAAGGRWRGAEVARRAGFSVLVCPGRPSRLAPCPATAGQPCLLAATSDVIVISVGGERRQGLIEAHRQLHPGVRLCTDAVSSSIEDHGVPILPAATTVEDIAAVIGGLTDDAIVGEVPAVAGPAR